MNIKPEPALTAVVLPTAQILPPSAKANLVDWLLEGCGVPATEIKQILAESKEAARAAVEAEIEAVDREAQAIAQRRAELVAQLRGGVYGHSSGGDTGDGAHSTVRPEVIR